MSEPRPFRVEIPQATINAIMRKVHDYEWHEAPEGPGLAESWAYGANLAYMKELCRYWLDVYDWRGWEAALNRFPQFVSTLDGIRLHFYREQGSGPSPTPLILSHGWPGSVFEFLHIIEKLAHPERFGGDEKDAFTVIVPSLPGYGFSGKPKRPIGPRTIARLFDTLMTDVLHLPDYIAQGGDWGSAISGWMGYEGKGCRAVHLNMMGWSAPGAVPETQQEKEQAAQAAQLFDAEGAYFREQATKPQTLSYAMMDSPVGVCAWIVEKFYGWSDIRTGFEDVYSKDVLLTNVMIYLVTRSFGTSTWLYRGLFEDQTGAPVPPGARIEKPVAIARFPVDIIPFPPKSQVERSMNVQRWTEFSEGGHFAALERPAEFVADLQAFGRELG
ncbi:MAG: alpha/beta hydrolase [Alphaproteobacteria bacterium]|nr:alpha/beta hydrolase [Alphaproteobacteria bacterium]MDE2014634.1 epoxide hydrolase [Alphaproteobacteria bacterium]MDE2074674.1 epoxide hydrolase [Alphaproteobacteria bacterium]